MQLTNAARKLKQRNIPFTYLSYVVDESDVSAKHVAASLDKPLDQLYKTICLENEQRKYAFFLISGDLDIDLKAAAKAWGAKKASPVPMKELEALTGYIRGGVSPIGAKKRFPVFLHDSAKQKDKIIISAGKRGYQIELTPDDLIRFTDGRWFTQ
ncbi:MULTISPECIES: Cys-tRNA(Pro) deacylase [unclassified Exiguobacterium]|uniref:Cys-tRNA(Pro) deacylase n=1 Tax=unclassified Exiguobacterium TaxID=2644629 RepID=UPI00103D3197|nr:MULTISPECIES: Cys-tRNA(Pro) deacylase [unclassified Exiguobacterium]TCI43248.1 Cys-tRNA(Pro) deacylase [Exiguobacterium sp. SH5S32]TCI49969.1 Cys-tRNA(Pro) deacylase [Exiguobacterium sp. SH1S4]TCI68370.1 Cys-tRNA(Pro) deacylase [Exiguobacterium sp. SH1S1]